MILFHSIVAASFFLPLISTSNSQNQFVSNKTKTKRTLSDQIYTNGQDKAVFYYMENPQTSDIPELQASASSPGIKNFYSSPSKPLALVTVQQPIQVFEQDSPKQVAAQQVLYEFQQTPTNAESNVHVKQLFQPNIEFTTPAPQHHNPHIEQLPTSQPLSSIHPATPVITANQHFLSTQPQVGRLVSSSSYHPATSETIVSPVQHNLYTNHALNSASFNYYNPLLPQTQQYQNTQINPKQIPGKYIYLNGKIVYNPIVQGQQGQPWLQNNFVNKGIYHNQQKLPLINYATRHNRPMQQNGIVYGNVGNPIGRQPNKLVTQGSYPPITNRFQPPKQVQPINKPSPPPQQQEESDETNEANDEEDEEREEKESDEEESDFEDDEDPYSYDHFSPEDDEYVDEEESYHPKQNSARQSREKNRYYDDESENGHEDVKRGASKQSPSYNNNSYRSRKHRMPPKYDSVENYGYREKYSSNMKYGQNNGKKEKPVGNYKKVKFSRKPGGKPKVEKIEGRYSDNIPVVHKHKVYREKWYLAKDFDEPNKKTRGI